MVGVLMVLSRPAWKSKCLLYALAVEAFVIGIVESTRYIFQDCTYPVNTEHCAIILQQLFPATRGENMAVFFLSFLYVCLLLSYGVLLWNADVQ